MNIFVLHDSPVFSAQMQCDKHVVKMVLETAQLLCSPFDSGNAPYKRTHYNHPCSVWTRASMGNYLWLCEHGLALCDEYSHRFGKTHKSLDVIHWCVENALTAPIPYSVDVSPFAQAMPPEYRQPSAVEAYRAYYRGAKREIAYWHNGRGAPEWWAA